MELREDDYILGCWFAVDNKGNDWLMTVKRKQDDPLNWQGEYRFRYKVDNKIFNSQDRKSFYSFEAKDINEHDLLKKMQEFFKVICMQYSKFSKYTEIKGDVEKFKFRYLQEDFANVQTVDKEEYERNKREGGDNAV